MARARATENPRSRSKAVLIEETTRGISKFQELLTAIEDFSQEGFPYRDAARAKAELQLRECVRRIFGEHSPEFQTYRNHKLRTTNKAETAQSVAVVKTLMQTLEDKKLELQGLKPPPTTDLPAEKKPRTSPQISLVPPTAHITMAPTPASSTPPMTLSVAMSTNLETPAAPPSASPHSAPSLPEAQAPAPSIMAPIQPSPISPAPAPTMPPPMATSPPIEAVPPPVPVAIAMAPPSSPPSASPIAPPPEEKTAMEQPSAPAALASSTTQPRTEIRPMAPAHTSNQTTLHSKTHPSTPIIPVHSPSAVQAAFEARSTQPRAEQDPLELLRKVCLRFHAVARQLRLRKDYRTTLEVEDDYDLQDLLCALLKVEFEEVGTDEWTPPYSGGAPRTTLLLDRDQIAVVAKKTRPGLTTKELADQVAADSAYYTKRDKCTALFFFIYDPEGRIGSPKRLETDLTSVSDRYVIDVLVAPK